MGVEVGDVVELEFDVVGVPVLVPGGIVLTGAELMVVVFGNRVVVGRCVRGGLDFERETVLTGAEVVELLVVVGVD